MQKLLIIALVCAFTVNCKPKKASVASTPAIAKPSVLEIANKKWANTTQSELDEGKVIYEGKCTTCHGKKNIVTRSEKSWLHEIDEMSPKAQLSLFEKLKLTKYILSYREANTTTD